MADEQQQEPEIVPTRYNFDNIEDYLATAERIAKEERLDEAIDVLREATARYPDSAAAQYDLGVAIFMKLREDLSHLELWENLTDEEELAEECHYAFQSAIERDRSMVAAYTNMGKLLALRGRYRKAVEAFEMSLALNPNQPGVAADLEYVRSQLEEDDVLKRNAPPGEGSK